MPGRQVEMRHDAFFREKEPAVWFEDGVQVFRQGIAGKPPVDFRPGQVFVRQVKTLATGKRPFHEGAVRCADGQAAGNV